MGQKVALKTFQIHNVTTGTPLPLASSSKWQTGVIIQALSANTKSVFIGDGAHPLTGGFELAPGTFYPVPMNDYMDLSLINMDAVVSGEGICVGYLDQIS